MLDRNTVKVLAVELLEGLGPNQIVLQGSQIGTETNGYKTPLVQPLTDIPTLFHLEPLHATSTN